MENKKKETLYDYSVVVPVYNEEQNIEFCFDEVSKTLNETNYTYEFVFVNDGSKDKSYDILKQLAEKHNHVKVLNFSKNFGQEAALMCGLKYASGSGIFNLDCDLQDPPRVMLEMIEKFNNGYDVVYGKRKVRRGESFLKKFTAKWFYRTFEKLTNIKMPKDTGNFRLISKQVAEVIVALPEHNKFLRSLNSWVGFKQTSVEFDRDKRLHGVTKFNYKKLTKLALNAILSNTNAPIVFINIFSILLAFASGVGLVTFGVLALYNIYFSTTIWLIPIISLCTSLIMLSVGTVGLYVYRTFEEAQNRPLYIVADSFNLNQ